MIWVSSSAVLAVVCALSLFWVVPRLQRRREAPVEAQVEIAGTGLAQEDPSSPGQPSSSVSRRRRIIMANTVSRPADSGAGHRPGGLRIKRDRAGIFLGGCSALLAALVTAVVAPFSSTVTWPWPVFLLLLCIGSVLALRYLAVQERAARRRSRPAGAPSADPHAPREDVVLFDNQHTDAEEVRDQPPGAADDIRPPAGDDVPKAPAPAAFTVDELRAEALRVARESAGGAQRTWEPVPVPRPTYADAPVVQRPAPEPLPVPEQPAARSTNLKDAVRAGEERGRAALDLDDVLKRRRA